MRAGGVLAFRPMRTICMAGTLLLLSGCPDSDARSLAEVIEAGALSVTVLESGGRLLPDGGVEKPWLVMMDAPECFRFEGSVQIDGVDLRVSSPGGYVVGGFPPSRYCLPATFELDPYEDRALSVLRIADDTSEVVMELVHPTAAREVSLYPPGTTELAWGSDLQLQWSVPEEPSPFETVTLVLDGGSARLGGGEGGTPVPYEGGLATLTLPPGEGETSAALNVRVHPKPVTHCTPAGVECALLIPAKWVELPVLLR